MCVCEAALSSESRDFSEMKVPVSAFYVLATPLLCTIDRLLDTSVLFSQVSVAKVGFFFYIARFEMRAWSVYMYRKSIFVSFVIW